MQYCTHVPIHHFSRYFKIAKHVHCYWLIKRHAKFDLQKINIRPHKINRFSSPPAWEMYSTSKIFYILFTKYKSAARSSFARFVIRFIFYMAYYCLKTQSNAVRNKLTLIFCPLTDDLTSFQGLPCFHTCQCPVDDLQLISADDLQISCASV